MKQNKPSIIQITPYYPPHTGGMENVVRELSGQLTKDGFSVSVYTSAIADTTESTVIDNFSVLRLKATEVAHTPLIWRLLPKLWRAPKNSVFHIHLAIAGIPEVALLVAKLRHIPTVLHFHLDVDPSGHFGFLLKLYKKTLFTWTLRTGDCVLVFSEDQAEFLAKKYGVLPEKIRILPNGVGDAFFMPKKRIAPVKKLDLLYVGRLHKQKRVDRIIEAMAMVKADCQLTIIGDGDDRAALEALSSSLKLCNVHFMGKKTGIDLRAYYRRADVLLLPSDKEGMSLVMLEALAAGLPIIASDVPGIKEHLTGTSILVKKPSATTFALAIDDLYKNRRLYIPRLSLASRALARRFSWQSVTTQLEEVYNSLPQQKLTKPTSKRGKIKLFVLLSLWWLAIITLRTLPSAPEVVINTLGFSFLLIVPGYLTIMCLRLKQVNPLAKVIMAVGVSLFELMLIGLLGNTILQWLGVKRPLDTPFLLGEVSLLLAGLYCVVWWRAGSVKFDIKNKLLALLPSRLDVFFAAVPLLFVLLSVIGAVSQNNGGSNLSTVIALVAITVYSAALILKSRKLSDNTFMVALFLIALSLLFMTSLRGWFTTGHDIQREFGVFELAKNSGVWKIQSFRDPYNACLSITLLPTMFFNVLKSFDPYIYKVFFQIIFALTPPLLFIFTRKWASRPLSYTSVLYFVAFPTFFTDMPMLNRQEIALLFFALMLFTAFQDSVSMRVRRNLFLVFAAGLILSHYSTTYSVVIILFISVVCRPILLRLARPLKDKQAFLQSALKSFQSTSNELKRITFTSVVLIIVGSFLWTSVLTNTGNNTGRVIKETFIAALHSLKEDVPKSNETKYNLLSYEPADLQKELGIYNNKIVEPARQRDSASYYPASDYKQESLTISTSNILPLTTFGRFLKAHGIPVESVNTITRQGFAKILQLLILIGLLYVLFRRALLRSLDTEYMTLVVGCVLFVVLQVVLPVISVEYGLLRAFQQSLMLLSIFIVMGSIVVASLAPTKRLKAYIPVIIALFFLVSSTGLITQTLGGYAAQLNLNNSGMYYDIYYLHRSEVVGIQWLDTLAKTHPAAKISLPDVQSDDYSFYKQQNTLFDVDPLSNIYPGLIRRDSYVYLGYSNVVKDQATVSYQGNTLTYNYPVKFLDDNKSLIYNNGGAKVYR